MTMRDEVYLAALAGLLHDVGKFAQRASQQPDDDYQSFNQDDYGAHGAHAKWSATFVSRYVPEGWRKGLSPVLYHHKPQERFGKIVALADRLSASERQKSDEKRQRQLLSIFCGLGEPDKRPADRFWPLTPLTLTEAGLFPGEPLSDGDENKAYDDLWRQFTDDVARLPGADRLAYLEGLYYALQKHTWCIPGAYYRSLPDVSLFDHSRTTAALATCLVDFDEPTLDELLNRQRQEEPIALLVGGDLSGVQDFIYTITAQGAAKGLRGRSFYLQLLTEAIARYVLRQLELPITNLLYAGGGHFYLLAPVAAASDLKRVQVAISHKLLEHHQGNLYLALGWTETVATDFKKFDEKWSKVGQAMSRAKRQRFSELDVQTLREDVFAPYGKGGDKEHECQVCHYYGPEVKPDGDDDDARRICPLCDSLETLGTQLRDADYLLLGETEPDDRPRAGFSDALAAFGLALGLTAADGSRVRQLDGKPSRAVLLAMRDLENVFDAADRVAAELGCPVATGTCYTVNVTPRNNGDVATFDWLQEQSRGVKQLGVLRMDVDDLGDLFGRWMKGNATLSRVASLSFALSLFFEGWIGELCRAVNQKRPDKVCAIYSGGDDLFIVGAWDVLPDLARTISTDLARFAAGNKLLHLSGGLTLHGGKYPLYQAAHDAEGALDAAKDLERKNGAHNKDAFNFLGLTIPWEQYTELTQLKDELVNLTTSEDQGGAGVPRALLQTLGTLYAHYLERSKKGKPHWGPWMWRGAYNLSRLAERHKHAQKRIERIRDDLKRQSYRYIKTIGPAARWAELLTRKEQKK
jgi:CRISPR-associated protein Csm1